MSKTSFPVSDTLEREHSPQMQKPHCAGWVSKNKNTNQSLLTAHLFLFTGIRRFELQLGIRGKHRI